MERSISDVARMAGVTSRTLRHYDDIGLLPPARVATNGYRWYGRTELLRLQRILLLRELEIPEHRIRQVLDGTTNELAALRNHRTELAAEHDRLDQILATVDHTITDLEGTAALDDEDFFTGLARRKDALEADLVSRYGDPAQQHFRTAERVTATWSREDHAQAADQGRTLLRRLSRARSDGANPNDELVLDMMVEHYEGVRALWPADAAAYHALADVLLDNADQRVIVEEVDPYLPPWLAEAIRAYATIRLGLNQPGS